MNDSWSDYFIHVNYFLLEGRAEQKKKTNLTTIKKQQLNILNDQEKSN